MTVLLLYIFRGKMRRKTCYLAAAPGTSFLLYAQLIYMIELRKPFLLNFQPI